MSVSNPFVVGDLVDVQLYRVGGPPQRPVGKIRGVVEHAGIEVDVRLIFEDDGGDEDAGGQYQEDVDDILAAEGSGMGVSDLVEGTVILLRNCQPEDCSLVARSLTREVFERLVPLSAAEAGHSADERLVELVRARLVGGKPPTWP